MGDIEAFLGRLKNAEGTLTESRRRILTRCDSVGAGVIVASPGYPHGAVAKKPFPPPRIKVTDDAAYIKVGQAARLVNDDTRAHLIAPKKGRRGKRRRALLINGAFRATARHPGTKGKHFMEKGREAAMPIVARTYQAGLHSELGRIFKGG